MAKAVHTKQQEREYGTLLITAKTVLIPSAHTHTYICAVPMNMAAIIERQKHKCKG